MARPGADLGADGRWADEPDERWPDLPDGDGFAEATLDGAASTVPTLWRRLEHREPDALIVQQRRR